MRGGQVVREARKRAQLSQRDLAELLGSTQPVIARWESGSAAPSFERVVEAVRACGFDLSFRIAARDDQHELLVRRNLGLTPAQRLDRMAVARAATGDLAAKVRPRADHEV